jgi:hypothetical protein
LLSNTTITGPAPDNPPAPAQAAAKPATAKRLPAVAQLQESQKKQVVEGKLAPYKAVMNQTVVTHDLLALPPNVHALSEISVDFAPGSNGGGLLMWVPLGMVNSNTDKLLSVLTKLERKGVTSGDAILFTQALETKLMKKHKQKKDAILDLFLIPLEVPCDAKRPSITLFRTSNDGDCGCFIMLNVPSVSDYAAGELMEDEETFDV